MASRRYGSVSRTFALLPAVMLLMVPSPARGGQPGTDREGQFTKVSRTLARAGDVIVVTGATNCELGDVGFLFIDFAGKVAGVSGSPVTYDFGKSGPVPFRSTIHVPRNARPGIVGVFFHNECPPEYQQRDPPAAALRIVPTTAVLSTVRTVRRGRVLSVLLPHCYGATTRIQHLTLRVGATTVTLTGRAAPDPDGHVSFRQRLPTRLPRGTATLAPTGAFICRGDTPPKPVDITLT